MIFIDSKPDINGDINGDNDSDIDHGGSFKIFGDKIET